MAEKKEYNNRADSRKDFSEKAKRIESEGFGGRVSPTGYTDCMLGMDDLDKLRRVKLNHQVND